MSQVTKLKSEGRVAAGKRLAEWNRKNKEQVPAQVNSSGDQVSTSGDQVPKSHTWKYLGVMLLIGVGAAAYYFYTHKKTPAAQALEPVKKQSKKWME